MDCASVRIVVNVKPDNPRKFPALIVATKLLPLPVSAPGADKLCAPDGCLVGY